MQETFETGPRRLLLNLALGLGTFIQVLDISIANVAIPYIAGDLAVSPEQGSWVITSFAASNAIVLPLTGWLSNYFGQVRLFVWSVFLFALASFCCGISSSLMMLVIFRTLQGAVAGSLIPLSQSLLLANNPPEKKGATLGLWGMIVIVAPILGPIAGGYITETYSWSWIFYLNVPVGIFSAAMTWKLLKNKESLLRRYPIDWWGLAFLAVGVGCLQVLLDKGEDLDWFSSPAILTLATVSIIALIYFGVWTKNHPYPVIDFSFFKSRNFLFGTLAITVGFLFYFGSTVIIPIWLQVEQGYTAFWAGLAVAPVGIIPFFLSAFLGKNLHRLHLPTLSALSFLIFAVTFFYQATFTTQIDLATLMWVRFLQGAGLALFFLPLVQLSLSDIPKEKIASASGVFNFVRILCGSGFGTSLAVAMWNRREILHHTVLTEALSASSTRTQEYLKAASKVTDSLQEQYAFLDQAATQQAYMMSTNDLCWLAACCFLVMVPMLYFCKSEGTST